MNVLLLYPTWTGAYGLFGHFAPEPRAAAEPLRSGCHR